MILYVDYEHPSTYLQPKREWLLAARARISYRLQDLIGQRCILQRYADVDAGAHCDLDDPATHLPCSDHSETFDAAHAVSLGTSRDPGPGR